MFDSVGKFAKSGKKNGVHEASFGAVSGAAVHPRLDAADRLRVRVLLEVHELLQVPGGLLPVQLQGPSSGRWRSPTAL